MATRETAATHAGEIDGETPVVAVDGLTKRFGSGSNAVTAVDDVSFEIAQGSVVGFLGPNGAGKTTTIKSILGTVVPDAGSVEIAGIDVFDRPRAACAHVDAMFEGARNDYWRLTVRENLRYFATIGGVDPNSVAGRHERLLDRLDLADVAGEPVRTLSRGMKQKVSLASVLATTADVVFLDEPTLGLDVESSLTLRAEIERLAAERDLTVVVSTHDMDVVEDVCDRAIVVRDGRIVADDAVDRLRHRFEAVGYRITSPDFDPETVAAIREDVTVTDVTDRGTTTRLTVATDEDADGDGFYALADALRRTGVRPETVETVEADLEDVFVELTSEDA
ncbi:ABC transporter ATP-binding protein [Halobacteriales archaeon SW_7_68_16]|nr:MAG: ABC transporter ATP-binding protein [Halobacteriales archaeon SW_7_68_16]